MHGSNTEVGSRKRIAVIGGGAAGLSAAYYLDDAHDVTVFEAGSYLGGHTNTVVIEAGPDAGLGVDTGFIVLNDHCYPTLHQWLSDLGVAWRYTDMSFSVFDLETKLQWGSRNIDHIFAQRLNLFRPSFLRMLTSIKRFWGAARKALASSEGENETLGDFLVRNKLTGPVASDYIVPIGAAIWSSPVHGILDFPARTFLSFFKNHGLLGYRDQPRWQTVVSGSHSYVKAFQQKFKGKVRLQAPVRTVRRFPNGVAVVSGAGSVEAFDEIVLAVHADLALKILSDPSLEEQKLFSAWQYQENQTILHTDAGVMPPLKRAWASWNYRKELGAMGNRPISVTYWMNLLQGFKSKEYYGVTLNPPSGLVRDEAIVKEISYHHPMYTTQSVATQGELQKLSGTNRTWYAGSYFGYGFHEDAVKSGVRAAKELLAANLPGSRLPTAVKMVQGV